MFYVYVLQSESDNNKFYLGSSKDLRQRLESHNLGKNKATKGSQWQLVYYEAYVSLSAARQREHKLKYDGRAKRFLMERIKESLKADNTKKDED
jgi:putative endonuclease